MNRICPVYPLEFTFYECPSNQRLCRNSPALFRGATLRKHFRCSSKCSFRHQLEITPNSEFTKNNLNSREATDLRSPCRRPRHSTKKLDPVNSRSTRHGRQSAVFANRPNGSSVLKRKNYLLLQKKNFPETHFTDEAAAGGKYSSTGYRRASNTSTHSDVIASMLARGSCVAHLPATCLASARLTPKSPSIRFAEVARSTQVATGRGSDPCPPTRALKDCIGDSLQLHSESSSHLFTNEANPLIQNGGPINRLLCEIFVSVEGREDKKNLHLLR